MKYEIKRDIGWTIFDKVGQTDRVQDEPADSIEEAKAAADKWLDDWIKEHPGYDWLEASAYHHEWKVFEDHTTETIRSEDWTKEQGFEWEKDDD